ncbi:MAG: hypothetical protein K2P94_00840 [Rhodospirillaceae bacterium]|nr:hypothetical protein [Rhodospirillaceae bacterium]
MAATKTKRSAKKRTAPTSAKVGARKEKPIDRVKLAPTPKDDKGISDQLALYNIICETLGGEKQGSGFLAFCPNPAHDNTDTPAMSVNMSGSKVVFHCHVCGEEGKPEILAALSAMGLWTTKPRAMFPVPAHAPALDLEAFGKKLKLGNPDLSWDYLDAQGELICTVARFPKKQFRPFTYWSSGEWQCKAPTEPKPLYGLDRLAQRPDSHVLICEGEKSADAAQARLPNSVCITWMGGTGGHEKADWSPLKGRSVCIWPDNDDAGRDAAEGVALCCLDAGAESVSIVDLPTGLPKKWDLADDAPEDCELDVEALINGASAYHRSHFGADPVTRFVYATMPDGFVDLIDNSILSGGQLDKEYLAQYRSGISRRLLKNPHFEKVRNLTYAPGADRFTTEDGQRKLNTWSPNPISPKAGDVTPMLDHIAYLFPNKEHQKLVIQWLAFQEQHPGVKIHWALVVVGIQGTGKTTLYEFAARIVGGKNATNIKAKELKSDFNGFMQNVQLLGVEEIYQDHRLEAANDLKTVITNRTIWINQKYLRPFEQPNRTNLFITSNFAKTAIALEDKDRRFCILNTTDRLKPEGYYMALYEWLDTRESTAAMRHYLREVDLSDFPAKGHAPMTEAKRDMAKANKHPAEEFLLRRFEEGDFPFEHDLINVGHVLDVMPPKFNKYREVPLTDFLKSIGAISIRNPVRMADGRKLRLWIIRDHDKWSEAKERELAVAYLRPFKPGQAESF